MRNPSAAAMRHVVDWREEHGRDPQEVLSATIRERELGSAESIAQVLHYRFKPTDADAARAQQIEAPEQETAHEEPVEREVKAPAEQLAQETTPEEADPDRARRLAEQLRQALRARAVLQQRKAADEIEVNELEERSLEL